MAGAGSDGNWEVEVKFHHGDFGPLRSRLIELGGALIGCEDEKDTYYRHPGRDFAQTGEALRIRTRGNLDGREPGTLAKAGSFPCDSGNTSIPSALGHPSVLCYKGPRLSGPAKVRREIETDVNGMEMHTILEALGFQPVMTISKTRESWKLGGEGEDCLICLDEAHGLGNFVEVEVMAKADKREEAQSKVIQLAQQLGLGAREDRSYLRMQLEKCR